MVCFPCVRCGKTKSVAQLERRIQSSTNRVVHVCKNACVEDGQSYLPMPKPEVPGRQVRAVA